MRLSVVPIVLLFAGASSAQLHAQYVPTWDPDADGDNYITVNDLLALLSVFEEADSDDDGIFDSQDDCIGSYDACGICNGTGVDADTDGVCDDVDPCVGALDVCGVCNGPGPSVPVIDQIIYVTDSLFVPPLGTWYVFSYAVDTLYTYTCPVLGCTDPAATNFNPSADIDDSSCLYGPAQCGGASSVTFDGHTYALVGIGTQCWFAENLRSDNYRNGDPIPGNLNSSQWGTATSGAQAIQNNNESSLAIYGRLYNWHAVNDGRGLCPSGFHVSSDFEWFELESSFGGSLMAATEMKSTAPAWDGNNSSGLTALPGGHRGYNAANYYNQGVAGRWWTSTANGTSAWYRSMNTGDSAVYRDYFPIRGGFSVRCVKDLEANTCNDNDGDGICSADEILGCTDSSASNFEANATEEDGSCTYGPAQCGGASSVTFDGHTYALVGIGTQCWFAENLRSDNYRNGDPIPGNLTDSQWTSISSGAQTVYGEGSSAVHDGSTDEVANLATYGRLYNWYAVNDSRGLCPSGFHVPSDEEWIALEIALGMTSSQANTTGWRGTNQGVQMKTSLWGGTNSSGFSALPGGRRDDDLGGYFSNLGEHGFWWSSTTYGNGAWYRDLSADSELVNRSPYFSRYGFSVRCVRD